VPHRRQGLVDGGREVGVAVLVEPAGHRYPERGHADVIRPGHQQCPGLVDGLVRSERALRLATISARIASTAPSRPLGAPQARPDKVARPALTASGGSSPD
jgi:hypothetical protein